MCLLSVRRKPHYSYKASHTLELTQNSQLNDIISSTHMASWKLIAFWPATALSWGLHLMLIISSSGSLRPLNTGYLIMFVCHQGFYVVTSDLTWPGDRARSLPAPRTPSPRTRSAWPGPAGTRPPGWWRRSDSRRGRWPPRGQGEPSDPGAASALRRTSTVSPSSDSESLQQK